MHGSKYDNRITPGPAYQESLAGAMPHFERKNDMMIVVIGAVLILIGILVGVL